MANADDTKVWDAVAAQYDSYVLDNFASDSNGVLTARLTTPSYILRGRLTAVFSADSDKCADAAQALISPILIPKKNLSSSAVSTPISRILSSLFWF